MRKENIFNRGWEFNLSEYGEAAGEDWVPVTLPHDWLIYDTDNLYRDGTGRYRKCFKLKKKADKSYYIFFEGVYMNSTVYVNGNKAGNWRYGYSSFEFDITDLLKDGSNEILVEIKHKSPNTRWYSGAGIFRDVIFRETDKTHIITDGVYISAHAGDVAAASCLCLNAEDRPHSNGNNPMPWEVTADIEITGDAEEIEIEHSIRLLEPEPSGLLINGNKDNTLYSVSRIQEDASGWLLNDSSKGDNCAVCGHPCGLRSEVKVSSVKTEDITKLLKAENEIVYGKTDSEGRKYYAGSEKYYGSDSVNIGSVQKVNAKFRTSFSIDNPFLWDITMPNLYELTTVLKKKGKIIDEVKTVFGLRTIEFTADHGCYLNGRHIKLYGVCDHHDLGALGAAFDMAAMRRKILKLKEMGVNAIRTSHNMPAKKLLQLADEMGILIDCEAFDMWRRVKTEYDYHNYFDDCYRMDVESWIRRDRNHPSIIMWSIGNEIYDCHADEAGFDITKELRRNVEKHDYMFNARATHGSNFMPWEGAQRCSDNLKLAGYNYGEKCYLSHHEEHPDWMIYGSETASTVQSRGVYHFPLRVSVMADDDEQCSTLGNCTTSWGAESAEWVTAADRDAIFSQGQFIWSGFDYIGEPTPYHTKNSYFGAVDTAGFEKDIFYIYKAEWTDASKTPFVHVFPYWDFNEGQLIDVRVASNLDKVELFVNGESRGIQSIDHQKGTELVKNWLIPYAKGEITAVGYDKTGNIVARESHKSFGDAVKLMFKDSYSNTDMLFLELSSLDADGNPVENDNSRVKISIEGNAELAGLDNGDSTDYENYKCNCRRLFAGKLLVMVRIKGAGEIRVTAESLNAEKAEYVYFSDGGNTEDYITPGNTITEAVLSSDTANDVQFDMNVKCLEEQFKTYYQTDIPVRKLELKVSGSRKLTPENREVTVQALVYPENASYTDIKWVQVNDYSVKSNLCDIEPYSTEDGYFCKVRAKGDGDFRIRCMTNNGKSMVQVISCLEFSAEGLGTAYLNPYEFIAGSLYTDFKGDIGNGNEKGVATPWGENSYIGYENIDFGDFGSDELTIPIFTLDSQEYSIGIWEGRPYEEGSVLLCDGRYCKPSIWNVYQEETYQLSKRLKGITSLYFTANAKYHIKGFSFTRQAKAFTRLSAVECSEIYGDNYRINSNSIDEIGNNVTIEFNNMDFGASGSNEIIISGRSNTDINSINLKIDSENDTVIQLLEFEHTEEITEKIFKIKPVSGKVKIAFVFLPGSNFDFKDFMFVQGEDA